MNGQFSPLIRKIGFLCGIFFLGWAAQAQAQTTPDNNRSSDTSHQHMMHHRWGGNRMGGDSLARHDGFHRPGAWAQGGHDGFHRPGGWQGHDSFRGPEGYAFHGRGQGRFGKGRFGQDRFGQDRFGHGRFGRGRFGRGGEFAHFTPEQRKQWMAINKDYAQKAKDLYNQDNLTLKQYKAGLVALQKEKKARLQALLTPLQKDEMTLRHKKMEDEARLRADQRLEHLRQALNLTDDQVSKIKAGQEALWTKAQAIHQNDDLLPQQRREQMKALMATRNDTFKSVLTPDQYTKFQQLRSHHRPGGPGGSGGPGGPGGPGGQKAT